jgi:hypothetical protein
MSRHNHAGRQFEPELYARLLVCSLGLVTLAAGFLIPIQFTGCFVPPARLNF